MSDPTPVEPLFVNDYRQARPRNDDGLNEVWLRIAPPPEDTEMTHEAVRRVVDTLQSQLGWGPERVMASVGHPRVLATVMASAGRQNESKKGFVKDGPREEKCPSCDGRGFINVAGVIPVGCKEC